MFRVRTGWLAKISSGLDDPAVSGDIYHPPYPQCDHVTPFLFVTRAAPTNTAIGRVETGTMSAQMSSVEWKKLRFVIMDAPRANNLHLYLRELKKQNVVCVVRVCEPTYPAAEVEAAGIKASRE